jgi:predicted transcriptional regulator
MKDDPKNNPQTEPTRSELEILQVLWKHGPSTVRFVNDRLNDEKRSIQYTSTLKIMQIMTDKGMLARDESSMKHVYSPLLEEKSTKGLLLDRFLDATFNGSAATLLMQLLGNKKTSKDELDEIKALINKIDPDKL